jgi:hypothetical protein
MVTEGKGRVYRHPTGGYILYLPKDLAKDSMPQLAKTISVEVKTSFKVGDNELTIEKWIEENRT